MNWGTIAWLVIVGLSFFVMMRGCGGMAMGGGGCGMPRVQQPSSKDKKDRTNV